MLARQMQVSRQYKLKDTKKDGRRRVIEYDRPSGGGGKFAIVHERGELDMQSSYGIPWDEEVEEVAEVTNEHGNCPACDRPVEPTNNPDNPVCRRNNVMCDCGWMGNVSHA